MSDLTSWLHEFADACEIVAAGRWPGPRTAARLREVADALTAAQQQGQAVSMAYTAGPDETHTRRFPLVQQGQAVAEDMGGFTSDTAALAFLHLIGNGNPNVERAVERLRQSLIAQSTQHGGGEVVAHGFYDPVTGAYSESQHTPRWLPAVVCTAPQSAPVAADWITGDGLQGIKAEAHFLTQHKEEAVQRAGKRLLDRADKIIAALSQQPAPSAPVGVEWPLSLLRAGHWREVYIGHRCMRLEVTYDYATWERLMAEIESALAQQPAAEAEADTLLRDLVEALDAAFISSWQSTAAWQKQLDAAREYLAAQHQEPKS